MTLVGFPNGSPALAMLGTVLFIFLFSGSPAHAMLETALLFTLYFSSAVHPLMPRWKQCCLLFVSSALVFVFDVASSSFVSYSAVSYPQRFTRSCAPTTCLDINMCGKAFEVAGRKYSYRKMEARLLEDLQGFERTFSESEDRKALLKDFLGSLKARDPLTLEAAKNGAEMVAKSSVFVENEKKELFVALYERIAATPPNPETVSQRTKRRSLQDYTRMPNFLTEHLWQKLLSTHSMDSKCDALFGHLVKLGLQLPSEPSFGMSATLLLWASPARENQFQLHSNFLRLKKALQQYMRSAPKSTTFLPQLPACFADLPEELRNAAFPGGVEPAKPPLEEGELHMVFRRMPLRVTKCVQVSCQTVDTLDAPQNGLSRFLQTLLHMSQGQQHGQHDVLITLTGGQGRGRLGAGVAHANQLMSGSSRESMSEATRAPSQLALPALPAPEAVQCEPQTPASCPAARPEVAAPVVDPLPEPHEAEPAEQRLLELAKQSCKAKTDTDTHPTGAVQMSAEKLKEMAEKRDAEKKGKGAKPNSSKVAKTPKHAKPYSSKAAKTPKQAKKHNDVAKPGKKKVVKAVKEPVHGQKGRKSRGRIPTKARRLKMMPKGCSTCRFVPGCCNSCWLKKGFHP